MEDKDLIQKTEIQKLDDNIDQIAKDLIVENDSDKSNDLINLFNWNISKKNALRIIKLNQLYDGITDQMIERFARRKGEFSNQDLLNYLNSVEASLEKQQKNMQTTEQIAPVQIQNNTQVNVNIMDSFDTESKQRITDAIKSILKQAGKKSADYESTDTIEFEDKTKQDSSEQTEIKLKEE